MRYARDDSNNRNPIDSRPVWAWVIALGLPGQVGAMLLRDSLPRA